MCIYIYIYTHTYYVFSLRSIQPQHTVGQSGLEIRLLPWADDKYKVVAYHTCVYIYIYIYIYYDNKNNNNNNENSMFIPNRLCLIKCV